MPGIGAFGSMGGMSAASFPYQNLAANRRQNTPAVETEENKAPQSATANGSASATRQPPPPPPPQGTELPDVERLDNASETLAQMRIKSADAADEAYELFRSNAQTQGMGQTPPPPPPEEGERPENGTGQVTPPSFGETQTSAQGMRQAPPAPDGMSQADSVGRTAPPPPPNGTPQVQPNDERENAKQAAPLAVSVAGIV